MKLLLPILIIVFSLTGLGCLEKALEYPKNTNKAQNQTEKEEIVLVGVVRSIDSYNKQIQIETINGFAEEIEITIDSVLSSGGQIFSGLENIREGILVEVIGERDLTSLIISAEMVEVIDDEKIKVVSPQSGSTIISPLIIEGFAKTADQKIYWHIKDQNNATQLSGSNSIGGDSSSYSAFKIEIYLPALESEEFTLEVFSKQPAEVGLVSIPLHLLSTNTSEFSIFFSNDRLNATRACDMVFPVTRNLSQTSATGRASLIELLNGPTETEIYQGYRSSLPYNTVITSFVINEGVARVTVSKEFSKTTTCEKQRAEEQIKQTLLQVGLVEDVRIEIE